ncbi:MAG: hypothetical protein PHR77_07760 [Kiritimatiellae bacterium]|nr:hypothetical protein [Kiritimatiellia bacterium]MDD5522425.1 hypothetical protein [Kiritimatiellia bacterium]
MKVFSRYSCRMIVLTVFTCLLISPIAFSANAPAPAKPVTKPAAAAPAPAAPAPAAPAPAKAGAEDSKAPATGAQSGANNPKLDPVLKKSMDELKYVYDVNPEGTCRMTMRLGKDRSHLVFVTSKKETYGGVEFRRVWATTLKSKEVPSSDILSKLLLDSAQKKFGAWEMQHWSDGYRVILAAKVPSDCSSLTLKAAIRLVLFGADEMEEQLTSKDDF